ncbi:lysylphosphatidylglycerol synthase domain-containing protein, partial [Phytoactinopolyspora endophytica]|uniref:lysylphosphatidylglycerol synthase domain-containing protein n=1 Tax=Phytoactinopolyspora endophytica TaxID=1642495 RepID=UPI00101BC359
MRSVTRWVGALVAVAGVAFVVRELVRSWDDVRDAISDADPALLVLAPVVGAFGMLLIGLGWRRCLAILGARRGYLDTMYRYYVGQLGKYVPGGIWPVVGRGEMARRGGVAGSVAYASTVLSIGVTYLAAILTVAIALVAGAAGGDGVAWQPVVALLPIGILALHPRVVAATLRLVRRVSGRELGIPVPSWGVSVGLVALHVPAWLAIGGATWLTAIAIDPWDPDLLNLMFATVLSWIVGLLVVPA